MTVTGVDPTDVMTGSTSLTASASISSVGGNLKSIDHTATGNVNVTSTKSLSTCLLHMFATSHVEFDFTVSTPGFLTVDIARGSLTYSDFSLEMEAPENSSFYEEYGSGFDFKTSRRLYLPAGTYSGYTTLDVGVDGKSAAAVGAPTGSIHATFAPAGSQSGAVQGKAKKYVTFPAAGAVPRTRSAPRS